MNDQYMDVKPSNIKPPYAGAKAVVLLSGGMDSTTLLYNVLSNGYKAHALGFDYGQRHLKELAAAQKIATKARTPFKLISLASVHDNILSHAGSSQTNESVRVPHGRYDDESMKQTVVPNRNMMMLSIATSYAIVLKADIVAYAAHHGDHAIYPDCRHEFMESIHATMRICDWHPVSLYAPFREMRKENIAHHGKALGVPFDLTWSCYEGNDIHCGRCGTCVERKEAFVLSDVPDPTEYAA